MLSRIEKSAATKNPQDFYYFVDGAQVGELSSNGGYDPARMNYSDSFVTRNWKWSANTTASQPFRWDNSNGTRRPSKAGQTRLRLARVPTGSEERGGRGSSPAENQARNSPFRSRRGGGCRGRRRRFGFRPGRAACCRR